MINKIDFKAKNLTSNAGLFLLLENAKSNGIFDFIENDLVFDNDSTNKIKMNHIKTMLCGHFIGIDKLERLKRHCCKVSDEAAFCLIQRPYISKTLLTRRISPRGSP
ncbi:hypothetical protein FTO40_26020 [Klebsiella pneumoniae]|nr:hypothetical protein FTO40_26020 [Klebsiella pneumoniae]